VPVLVPCNPVGRTGIVGRGHLGRWGPNHAAGLFVIEFYFIYFQKFHFNLL
jgi:hypothetical protein